MDNMTCGDKHSIPCSLAVISFKTSSMTGKALVSAMAGLLAGTTAFNGRCEASDSAETLPPTSSTLAACTLPAGVPTLEEMAGDWKNRTELEQFPSIHNFNGQMLVNKDLASVSWLASPPFSQCFHSGVLEVNGKVPVAEKFRWYPYQSVRSGSVDGLAIETVNRMVLDARGVLWRITLSNTEAGVLSGKISLGLIGAVSKLTAPDSWSWAYAQPGPGG